MRTKNLIEVKAQMQRIERMMLNDNFYPKDRKRYAKWTNMIDSIDRNLLAYFQVNHLWEKKAYERRNDPLPYDVRVTH